MVRLAKAELKQLNVDNEVFKRIKKYKRTIYTIQNEESGLQNKHGIIIVNNKNNKKLKRKIVKVYTQDNLAELKTFLKRKEKYLYPKKFEDNGKITAIEFRYNKKIFRKILLGILIIVLLLFCYRFISNKIEDIKARKFYNNINELTKDRTDYVFIEINPSFVLTIKDNKVNDVACLNDDCVSIYNDIDIKGKNINESIDNLYNISKEKGFDTSKGVKVKVSNNINIESKDYITIEYIDTAKEKELLNEVKNNEEIKNISNDDYYSKLWKELKKDSKYDEIYTCNMNADSELGCYFKEEFLYPLERNVDGIGYNGCQTEATCIILDAEVVKDISNTLVKFGVERKNDELYIDGIGYTIEALDEEGPYLYGTLDSYIYIDDIPAEYHDGFSNLFSEFNDGTKFKCGLEVDIPLNKSTNLLKLNKYRVVNEAIKITENSMEIMCIK